MGKEDRDDLLYCLAADHTILLTVAHMLGQVMNADIKEAYKLLNAAREEVNAKINKMRNKR